MKVPDFNELARQLNAGENGVDLEAADRLWVEVLQLAQWFVLMSPRSAQDNTPSAQRIGDKVWFLVFTDVEKLANYAARNQNLDAGGNPLYLSLSPQQGIELARTMEASNVYGFRFNEAQPHGWYIPLADLVRIPPYLAEKGLL